MAGHSDGPSALNPTTARPEGSGTLSLRTVVVDGPLALRMRRLQAARNREIGLQIYTLPQLAARLAGGFSRPATADALDPAIRAALQLGGYGDLGPLSDLPGMVRAVSRTLDRLWRAGVAPADHADHHPRLRDLALMDERVRTTLRPGALAVPDLTTAAVSRLGLAHGVLGEVMFERLHHVSPVWRPLLEALAEAVPVTWVGARPPLGWSVGAVEHEGASASPSIPQIEAVICSDPYGEVVEAMRWARELIASGRAEPYEIALATASPAAWDDHFLGLATAADFPIHFSHGVPALTSVEGQACAALAELLLQGLSQDRVRRVLAHAAGRSRALAGLSESPLLGLPTGASLSTLPQWRQALEAARARRSDGESPATILLPVLDLVAAGRSAAEAAGAALLTPRAADLWAAALRAAPPEALPFSLEALRIPDGRDPGASVVWAPAAHLMGAPRPWVWLLGLTARAWPRPREDDPLLPAHILALDPRDAPSRPDADRQAFEVIARGATERLVLSYGRRSRQGGLQARSPLIPRNVPPTVLRRRRIPEHAFSEGDRLQARPQEASAQPGVVRAVGCVRGRRAPEVNAHDGVIRADHPAILRILSEPQSASSLRRLLRDPLGYVWRYALGWQATLEEVQTLSLNDRAFGDLVHQLLQRTVSALEPDPGFGAASPEALDAALAAAVAVVGEQWPTERPAPPPLLWRHTLDVAGDLARRALTLDLPFHPGTRSWTEVGFGDPRATAQEGAPWNATTPVTAPGTTILIRGRIDRLDLAVNDQGARVTDYKTGEPALRSNDRVVAGGAELQRVLYAAAVRHHRPEIRVMADLVYLSLDSPTRARLNDVDAAMAEAACHLNTGVANLQSGVALPGPDANEAWNPLILALPAAGEPYFQIKQRAISRAFGALAPVWIAR